jgi:HAMP domain-containing protein
MRFNVTIVFILTTIGMFCLFMAERRDLKKTQKLLEAAEKTIYSTPIKELTANFRDFVQSIDGHVSPEVDAAIKKLEEEQKPKLLPPPPPPVVSTKKKNQRAVMNVTIWNLFVVDFKAAEDSDEKISVIRRWGKKYVFPVQSQGELVALKIFDDYEREELREYFDDEHATPVLTMGS